MYICSYYQTRKKTQNFIEMVATTSVMGAPQPTTSNSARKIELQAFDDTKSGVKGLVDSGVQTIPQIFVHSPNSLDKNPVDETKKFIIPTIDLQGLNDDRQEIVDKVQYASETYGFFQVVNHGIPVNVMDEMLNGVRRFFEQDNEVKKQYYTRDVTKKVVYNSNYDLFSSPVANWRDSFFCFMAPSPPEPDELPEECR